MDSPHEYEETEGVTELNWLNFDLQEEYNLLNCIERGLNRLKN